MNISLQKQNGLYVNYWTKAGEDSKKENSDNKITITTVVTDKNGKEWTRIIKRHPTLNDLIFKKGMPFNHGLTKEQKVERFEKSPYSHKHDNLLLGLYSKEDRIKKQQYFQAAHNSKIENLMLDRNIITSNRKIQALKDKPNLLILRRLDSKHKPYDFSVNSSGKTLKELQDDANLLMDSVRSKMNDIYNIEVWNRNEYLRRFTNGKPYYSVAA